MSDPRVELSEETVKSHTRRIPASSTQSTGRKGVTIALKRGIIDF
jgi:hypothetical protein